MTLKILFTYLQATEFFTYATLQAIVTVIFAVMSWFYKYKDYGVCHDDYRSEGGGEKTIIDDNELPDKLIPSDNEEQE